MSSLRIPLLTSSTIVSGWSDENYENERDLIFLSDGIRFSGSKRVYTYHDITHIGVFEKPDRFSFICPNREGIPRIYTHYGDGHKCFKEFEYRAKKLLENN